MNERLAQDDTLKIGSVTRTRPKILVWAWVLALLIPVVGGFAVSELLGVVCKPYIIARAPERSHTTKY